MQITITQRVQSKLGQLGEDQVQQEVTSWRDGGDRGNVTQVSIAVEAEHEEPNVVTGWVW